jgi:hypothetical protein
MFLASSAEIHFAYCFCIQRALIYSDLIVSLPFLFFYEVILTGFKMYFLSVTEDQVLAVNHNFSHASLGTSISSQLTFLRAQFRAKEMKMES